MLTSVGQLKTKEGQPDLGGDLVAAEMSKDTKVLTYQEHVRLQLELLKFSTSNNIGTTSKGYLESAQGIAIYTGIENIVKTPERVVMCGDVMTILPEKPTNGETILAHELTEETDVALKSLRQRHGILNLKDIPITTVMVRTHLEIGNLLPRIARLSGVISRTIPPFFNTFNLQASKFAREVYGEEMGPIISLFSYMHEDGHLVFTQDRREKLRANLVVPDTNTRDVDLTITSTVLDPYYADELYWELWANRLPDENRKVYVNGKPVFPDWTASQGEDRNFNGRAIFEKRVFGNFSERFTTHYPEPYENLDYPFVMDPADAQEYLRVREYIEGIKDPKFDWLHKL